MNDLIEKIRYFYHELKIYKKSDIDKLYLNSKITELEYLYILGE